MAGVVGTSAGGAPARTIWSWSSVQVRFSRKNVKARVRPIVVPIWRNRVRSAVAAPRSPYGTAFWTMIVNTAKVGPTPKPATNIQPHRTTFGVSSRRNDIRYSPMARITRPPTTTALYLPVRLTTMPEPIDAMIRPIRNGSSW